MKTTLLLLLASRVVLAANYYIAQTSTGGGTGVDCANAKPYTAFNNNTLNLQPGDRVHYCGTGAFPAANGGLSFPASGVAGSVISLVFEPGAILQSDAFSTAGAVSTNGKNYLLIDGQGQGVIQNTANGSNLANHKATELINFDGSHNVEIRNFNGSGGIHNSYVNTGVNSLTSASGNGTTMTYTCSGTCQISAGATVTVHSNSISGYNVTDATVIGANSSTFSVAGATTGTGLGGAYSDETSGMVAIRCVSCYVGAMNVLIHDNVIDNAQFGILMSYEAGSSSALSIYNNKMSNMEIHIRIGDGDVNCILTGTAIYGNEISDWINWDDLDNNNHHVGIHLFANHIASGSGITGSLIYNNYLHGDLGVNQTAFGIFTENVVGTSGCNGMLAFNNVLVGSNATGHAPGNYFQPKNSAYVCFYNNTIVAPANTGTCLETNGELFGTGLIDWKNNICDTASTGVYETSVTDDIRAAGTDNNLYYNSPAQVFRYHSGGAAAFDTWKANCGCDGSSLTSNPNLDGTYRLQAGSPAINAGANLTGLGITALNTDRAGNQRPVAGAWAIGAYQFSGTLPPSSLTATVH